MHGIQDCSTGHLQMWYDHTMQNGPPTGHLQHYASRGHPACPLRYTLRLEDYCMHDCGKMSQRARTRTRRRCISYVDAAAPAAAGCEKRSSFSKKAKPPAAPPSESFSASGKGMPARAANVEDLVQRIFPFFSWQRDACKSSKRQGSDAANIPFFPSKGMPAGAARVEDETQQLLISFGKGCLRDAFGFNGNKSPHQSRSKGGKH
eukprot:221572-Pelagomonas_calceolata.AAC.2